MFKIFTWTKCLEKGTWNKDLCIGSKGKWRWSVVWIPFRGLSRGDKSVGLEVCNSFPSHLRSSSNDRSYNPSSGFRHCNRCKLHGKTIPYFFLTLEWCSNFYPAVLRKWICCLLASLQHESSLNQRFKVFLNRLKTKRRLLYLKTQFVPSSKHFSSGL